jgi:hypothetical protein
MSNFTRKSVPPPDIKEGEILKARILDVKKVISQWKNDDGTQKEQLQFDLQLEGGYNLKTWTAYTTHPSDKSYLGKLALTFEQSTKKIYSSVDDFLTALQHYGLVYVKVKGFREYEGKLYPTFTLVSDKIPPPKQEQGKL